MLYNQKDINVAHKHKTFPIIKAINEYKTEYKVKPISKIKLFENYCKRYNGLMLDHMDVDFFTKYMLMYIPRYSLELSGKEIKRHLLYIHELLGFINKKYHYDLTEAYKKLYMSNFEELSRVIYIRRSLQRFTETPVISFSPMVINLQSYKNHRDQPVIGQKKMIYEQGLFEVIEILGSYVVLKKKTSEMFIKLKIDKKVTNDMHVKDMMHMRIKRKLFYTTWDIIELKQYYSNQVGCYL